MTRALVPAKVNVAVPGGCGEAERAAPPHAEAIAAVNTTSDGAQTFRNIGSTLRASRTPANPHASTANQSTE